MGIRDHLERVAAWFGFGVDEDDYYEEEQERRHYARDRYAGDAPNAEPRPTVRRLGQSERSSAFGTSLGDLFGGESSNRDRSYGAGASGSSHLRAVPDPRIPQTRVSVVEPTSFNDGQALADSFKLQQPVILQMQQADGDLSSRRVEFFAGLTYALEGQI